MRIECNIPPAKINQLHNGGPHPPRPLNHLYEDPVNIIHFCVEHPSHPSRSIGAMRVDVNSERHGKFQTTFGPNAATKQVRRTARWVLVRRTIKFRNPSRHQLDGPEVATVPSLTRVVNSVGERAGVNDEETDGRSLRKGFSTPSNRNMFIC